MSQPEQFDVIILGSGQGGKRLAWHLAKSGKKVAAVERRWIGGSCVAVACLPSKNEIWSARVAHLVRNAAHFGTLTEGIKIDMRTVRDRKQGMIDREIEAHLDAYKSSGAELIMGNGRFVGPKTLEVALNDGGTRLLAGKEVVINIGTHAAIPDVPGMEAARPLTHIEALELDCLPAHLIVLGGGYVGIEMAQAYRRFGSRVTIIEPGRQLMGREDTDVSEETLRILKGEGIEVLLNAQPVRVNGLSGDAVTVSVKTPAGEQTIEGSDLLVAVGRVANTQASVLKRPGWTSMHAASSASTNGCKRARPACGPSAKPPAVRSLRMSPWTISGSFGTTWRAATAEPTIGWCPTSCSLIRRSPG